MAWVALSMNKGALAAVQSVALGLGALPLYAVAMRMTRQTAVALLVTASYLLHPCVPGIGEDVHVVPFAPVMLALAWAVIAERTRLAAALFVVALASRADAGLYVAVFALYLLLEAEPPRLARWMFGIAAACFVATLLVSSSSVEPRFANPLSAIDEIVSSGERWQFVVLVLLPVALLPLVTSRGALLVAPGLGACLVGASDRWSIEHAYAAPLLPFLFLGTVLGIARIRQSRTRTVLAIVVLVATALVTSKFAREPVLNGPRVRRDLTAASTRPQ
jgi:uncharacterized membrane protein